MADLNSTLTALLADPSATPTPENVDELLGRYPFFTFPAFLLLRRSPDSVSPDERTRLLGRLALNAPDPETLMSLLAAEREIPEPFYPDTVPSRPATDDAIDTFLSRYGHSDPKEIALLERLIFNPAPDYSTLLAREEEESLPEMPVAGSETAGSQDALIDAFILSQRAPQPVAETVQMPALDEEPRASAPTVDDSSLSESLAKMYIRRKRYDKAFEIIHTLSLKNPKKSVYFADQLRFLRKLMLNRGMTPPGENARSAE